jgi:hypothetical protein
MQPERSCTTRNDEARSDWGILVCLIGPEDQRPWSVAELVRERGDEVTARDAIDRLSRSGLIHLTGDGLVFPTRSALHFTEIYA